MLKLFLYLVFGRLQAPCPSMQSQALQRYKPVTTDRYPLSPTAVPVGPQEEYSWRSSKEDEGQEGLAPQPEERARAATYGKHHSKQLFMVHTLPRGSFLTGKCTSTHTWKQPGIYPMYNQESATEAFLAEQILPGCLHGQGPEVGTHSLKWISTTLMFVLWWDGSCQWCMKKGTSSVWWWDESNFGPQLLQLWDIGTRKRFVPWGSILVLS